MNAGTIVSGRIGEELASDLERLADKLGQTREWVVAQALERYVVPELELLDSLDEAEAAIDRGEFYTHEQMLESLKARYRPDRAA